MPAYKDGELIITVPYLSMPVNNPIPWIGMPVYWKGDWSFIDRVDSSGYAVTDTGVCLEEYTRLETGLNTFKIPGTKDTPPMTFDTVSKLMGIYRFGETARKHGKIWQEIHIDEAVVMGYEDWEMLYLPRGYLFTEIFRVNGVKQSNLFDPKALKRLNQDGRTKCAQCNMPLATPFPGWSKMNHCKACE